MRSSPYLEWLQAHSAGLRLAMIPILVTLVAAVYGLVHVTGGIKFVYSHSMYVPILLAGFVFGVKGGVLVGLIGGFALGPFMPIDVATGEAQQTINWLYRTGFFTLVGFLSGAASDSVRAYVRHIAWSAQHDESSGLPNRLALVEALTLASRRPESHAHPTALILIHLENSNELSSAFGFTIVDEVVRHMAARLTQVLPNHEHAYRIDSDKLAVWVQGAPAADKDGTLEALAKAFREPIAADGIALHGDVRMGCVCFDRVAEEPASYLQNAQAALAVASERTLDSAIFGPHINRNARENLESLGELKEALAGRLLTLHYQPKVLIETGVVHSVEALMRWSHPVRGMIPPGRFIPRAELSTLIDPLTAFAIDGALAQLQQWMRQGMDLSMAVNISTRNLLQPRFAERVLERLDHYRISPERLELEVTENALMVDIESALAELGRLDGMRIVLSIDDFGTGYSSLQYLSDLPVSVIKVDQTFVRKLPTDAGAAHIVEAAVSLAHRVGLKVVAEGVENQETYDFLRDLGCDLAQGFHICRPVSARDFDHWHAGNGGRFHGAATQAVG